MRRMLPRYTSRAFITLAALVVSGAILFSTSQNVQDAESRLAKIDAQIAAEKERMDVLEAEWAYLNTPYRLEMLSAQYLGLDDGDVENIVPYQDVKFDDFDAAPETLPSEPVVFTPAPASAPTPKEKPKSLAKPRALPMKAKPAAPVQKAPSKGDMNDLLGRLAKPEGGA